MILFMFKEKKKVCNLNHARSFLQNTWRILIYSSMNLTIKCCVSDGDIDQKNKNILIIYHTYAFYQEFRGLNHKLQALT